MLSPFKVSRSEIKFLSLFIFLFFIKVGLPIKAHYQWIPERRTHGSTHLKLVNTDLWRVEVDSLWFKNLTKKVTFWQTRSLFKTSWIWYKLLYGSYSVKSRQGVLNSYKHFKFLLKVVHPDQTPLIIHWSVHNRRAELNLLSILFMSSIKYFSF